MTKTLRYALIALLAIVCNTKALAGEPTKVLTFPTYNDNGISAYTETWTATVNGDVWTLTGFNNNKNAWAYVRCGQKSTDQTASITSPAVDAAITDVVVTIDKATNVNKATLTVLNGDAEVTAIDVTEKFTNGELDITVEGAKGYSYKLTIESKAGANGSTQISKVALYEAGQFAAVHIANTAETAYTVAEAIKLIDAGEALAETVYVKGIISQIDSYNSTYKSIQYWISDDGTTAVQLECYSGKGLNGADFTSKDDLKVGATVIVKGTLTKYKTTYEFTQSNELASYDESTATGIESVKAAADNAPAYNVAGQQVGAGYKGLVIKNGRKYIVK